MTTKNKTQFKPLSDRVLLERTQEETTQGGIVLPDSAKKKQKTATVIAVGPGKTTAEGKTLPMSVKAGDTVLLDDYSGTEVKIDDQEYVIVRQDEILAIVE